MPCSKDRFTVLLLKKSTENKLRRNESQHQQIQHRSPLSKELPRFAFGGCEPGGGEEPERPSGCGRGTSPRTSSRTAAVPCGCGPTVTQNRREHLPSAPAATLVPGTSTSKALQSLRIGSGQRLEGAAEARTRTPGQQVRRALSLRLRRRPRQDRDAGGDHSQQAR